MHGSTGTRCVLWTKNSTSCETVLVFLWNRTYLMFAGDRITSFRWYKIYTRCNCWGKRQGYLPGTVTSVCGGTGLDCLLGIGSGLRWGRGQSAFGGQDRAVCWKQALCWRARTGLSSGDRSRLSAADRTRCQLRDRIRLFAGHRANVFAV